MDENTMKMLLRGFASALKKLDPKSEFLCLISIPEGSRRHKVAFLASDKGKYALAGIIVQMLQNKDASADIMRNIFAEAMMLAEKAIAMKEPVSKKGLDVEETMAEIMKIFEK